MPDAISGLASSVEPFTEIITGTIAYSADSYTFTVPKTENLLAIYITHRPKTKYSSITSNKGITTAFFEIERKFSVSYNGTTNCLQYYNGGLDSYENVVDKLTYSDGVLTSTTYLFIQNVSYYYVLFYGNY